MLADWFACSALRLSPALTAAYLDILRALREPERGDVATEAIAQLRGVETGLMLYALPHVLAAHRRHAEQAALAGQAEEFYQALTDVAGGRDDGILEQTFRGLGDSGLVFSARLSTLTDSVKEPDETVATTEPYHDLLRHPRAGVVAALLHEFAMREPAEFVRWLGDGRPAFVAAATRGSYGRLPLLLVSTALAAVDRSEKTVRELTEALWTFGDGTADLEPDLVAAALRVAFGVPGSATPPTVGELESEAVTGAALRAWRGRSALDPISGPAAPDPARVAAFARLGGGQGYRGSDMSAVLWHCSAWALAGEVDPAGTADRLRDWWQAPVEKTTFPVRVDVPCGPAYQAAFFHLHALMRSQGLPVRDDNGVRPFDGPITACAPAARALLGSPWLLRNDVTWDLRETAKPVFPRAGDPVALLRMYAAAQLAGDLLQRVTAAADGEDQDHLLALLFHVRDVLTDVKIRRVLSTLTKGEPASVEELSYPLHGLLLHVSRTVDRLAKDDIAQVTAERLVRFVTTGAGAPGHVADRAPQHNKLFHFAGQEICLHWMQSESSGVLDGAGQRPGTWFAGDTPPALTLLRELIAKGDRRKSGGPDPATPLRLLRELFPGEPASAGEWDWGADIDRLRQRHLYQKGRYGRGAVLHLNTLLLAPPYPVEHWARMEDEEDLAGWVGDKSAPLAMKNARLAALLQRPDLGDIDEHPEWVDEWLDHLGSLNEKWELARAVRPPLIELLRAPVRGDGSQLRLARAGEAVIDTVLDLSRDAHRYYYLLLRVLSEDLPIGVDAATEWRFRAAAVMYRLQQLDPVSAEPASPYGVRRRRLSDQVTALNLQRFLRRWAGQHISSQDGTLGDAVERLWQQLRRRALPAGRHRLDAVDGPDGWRSERLLHTANVDLYGDALIRYELDVDPELTQRADPVVDLFRTGPSRPDLRVVTERRQPVLGLVSAVQQDTTPPTVWVNCGLGQSLPRALDPSETVPRLGDPVAVTLSQARQGLRLGRLRKLSQARAAHGKVREATVHPLSAYPGLAVTIDEREIYAEVDPGVETAMRTRWDPDLSRCLRRPAADRDAPQRPWKTLAAWDENLGLWLPVDRMMAELLAGEPDLYSAEGTLSVTFAGHAKHPATGDDCLRFVSRPGISYLLTEPDFTATAWSRLQGALSEDVPGMIVRLRAAADGRLSLDENEAPGQESPAFDDSNRRWLDLFSSDDGDLRVATRSGDRWLLKVAGPAGFPAEVEVQGLPYADEPQRLCGVVGWGDREARSATARGVPLRDDGVRHPEQADLARWNALRKLESGAFLTIGGAIRRNLSEERVVAATADGLRVWLPTETIALHTTAEDIDRFCRGRTARVEQDGVRPVAKERDAQPVGPDDLTGLTRAETPGDLETARDLWAGAERVEGMIVQRHRENGLTAAYGVWILAGDRVLLTTVPESALEAGVRFPGDHLVGSRDARGWTFAVQARWLVARCLYQVAERREQSWKLVGIDDRQGPPRWIWQDPARPVLAFTAPERHTWPKAKKTSIRRRTKNPWFFNDAWHVSVEVVQDDIVQVGTALEFPAEVRQELRHPHLRLTGRRHPATGEQLLDVRREFVLQPAVSVPRSAERPVRADDRPRRWEQALGAGRHHLEGRRVNDRFLVNGVLAPHPDGTWQNWLPLRPGEQPFVRVPDEYAGVSARAQILPHGDGFLASCAAAVPLTVSDLREKWNLASDGSRRVLTNRMYYAGDVGTGGDHSVYRFEWGPGWVLDVPGDELLLSGAPVGSGSRRSWLFHGDRIRALDVRTGDDGRYLLNIDGDDIAPTIESQLFREAAEDVVHEIEVRVDLARDTVTVLRVHTRDLDRPGTDVRRLHARDQVTTTAILDEKSTGRLLREERAAAPAAGVVDRRILARLHLDPLISHHGRDHVFCQVQPFAVTTDDTRGLRARDVLYLTGTQLKETARGSYAEFRLSERAATPGKPLVVQVRPRVFSYSSALLGKLPASYIEKRPMLVRLMPASDDAAAGNVWQGTIIGTPSRPLDALRGQLRLQEGSLYAVVGGDGKRIELAPGVFFRIEDAARGPAVADGALVRVTAPDGRLRLEVALPAEDRYIERSRPVVVLPKNSLLRPGGLARSAQGRSFTIAGLSSLAAGVSAADAHQVMTTEHPKIMETHRHPSGQISLRLPRDSVRAVLVDVDDSLDLPGYRTVPGSGITEQGTLPWARLSFADASVQELRERCRTGTWRYHDARTGHWTADGTTLVETRLPDPADISCEPVFLAERAGPSLRYPGRELSSYGFPAGELLDRPDLQDRDLNLAVAGLSRAGLWVELSPGRVVELPANLFSVNETSLGTMDWTRFAVGDQISVRVARLRGNDHPSLEFVDWAPGVRSAFGTAPGTARMLLPVAFQDTVAGSLFLGAGRDIAKYPAAADTLERHPATSTVWLDRHNDLQPAADRPIQPGDIVLLGLDPRTEQLIAHGTSGLRVALAPAERDTWPGSRWLPEALHDPDGRRELIVQLGGSLPVTVESIDGETLLVSRRHQPAGWWPRNKIVRTEIVARLGRRMMIARCGGALYRIAVDQAVGGIGPATASSTRTAVATVAQAFADNRQKLWWHTDANGEPHAGLQAPGTGEVTLTSVHSIDDGGRCIGVVGRDARSLAHGWLPAKLASWAGPLPAAVLDRHLARTATFVAFRDRSGGCSVIDRPIVDRELSLLRVGSTLPVTICEKLPGRKAGRSRYLARARATDVLLIMEAEEEYEPGRGLLIEVSAITESPTVLVIAAHIGTRKVPLDIPAPILAALRAIHPVDPAPEPDPAALERALSPYAGYATAWRQGIQDPGPAAGEARELIVGAAATALDEPDHPLLRTALIDWLHRGGAEALGGDNNYPLAPLLAGAYVATRLGRDDPAAARLAVFITHQAGRRATASTHLEALVRHWVQRPERHADEGGWKRLRSLHLAAELNLTQLRSMLGFCHTVTAKPIARGEEDQRAPVARALLAAAGQLPSADRVESDAPMLAGLAALGRGLSPQDGAVTAQAALLPPQQEVLRQALVDCVQGAMAITLLPAVEELPSAAARFVATITGDLERPHAPGAQRAAG